MYLSVEGAHDKVIVIVQALDAAHGRFLHDDGVMRAIAGLARVCSQVDATHHAVSRAVEQSVALLCASGQFKCTVLWVA